MHQLHISNIQHWAMGMCYVICPAYITMPVCTIQYFLFQFGTLHIFMQYPPFASICSLLHSHYSLLVHIYDEASTQLFVCMVNISINVCNAWPLSLSLCTPASHFKLPFVALSPQFYATFVLPFKHTCILGRVENSIHCMLHTSCRSYNHIVLVCASVHHL